MALELADGAVVPEVGTFAARALTLFAKDATFAVAAKKHTSAPGRVSIAGAALPEASPKRCAAQLAALAVLCGEIGTGDSTPEQLGGVVSALKAARNAASKSLKAVLDSALEKADNKQKTARAERKPLGEPCLMCRRRFSYKQAGSRRWRSRSGWFRWNRSSIDD